MISISPIFRKNSILAGLLILFSLSVHSTLFGLSKNTQDSSVARFDSANIDQVVIPLERVPLSSFAIFESPRIDFNFHDLISRKPLEKGLRGFPPGVTIEFYGIFELSALQFLLYDNRPEKMNRELWEPYDLEVPVDSKVSFVNGQDRNGNAVFFFDTNNNEDFSDEHAIYPETFGTAFRLMSYILPGKLPYGQRANATVEFEYNDGRIARTQRVDVVIHKYPQYTKVQKDPTIPKFKGKIAEYRKGQVEIDGQSYDLAIYNKERFATYSTKIFNRILWDLDRDGVFEKERESAEYYDVNNPFNIGGITFEVKSVSASGDEIILRKSDVSVPTKIEIKRGFVAPDFAVRDIDGKNLQLSNFRGKYVLLDFWSTGCGPCVKDTPRLKALSEKFDRNNFEIIGVSADTRRHKVENYVAKSHIGWSQILDAIDNNNKVSKMYNIGGLPHYVLIDRQGKVMMTNRSFRVILTLISPLL